VFTGCSGVGVVFTCLHTTHQRIVYLVARFVNRYYMIYCHPCLAYAEVAVNDGWGKFTLKCERDSGAYEQITSIVLRIIRCKGVQGANLVLVFSSRSA
jgi:hypothetical protein